MTRYLILVLALFAGAAAHADTKRGYDLWNSGDYAAAVAEWRPLAIAGDPVAQYDMAQAYKLGRGVAPDPQLAESWYAKAAAQGHIPSRDDYGLMLFANGNRAGAMPYIEESAARGEPRAQYVLATALFNGDGREQDWVRAYALMTRASAAGITAASASLARMDQYIPLDQRQRGLALASTLTKAPAASVMLADAESDAVAIVDAAPKPVSHGEPEKRKTAVADRAPRQIPVPKLIAATPGPVVTSGQAWRVQLGAFGDIAKAKTLWAVLQARLPVLAPYRAQFVKAGPVTRLQVGAIASRAAANALCARLNASGTPCLPVAP